MAKKIPSRKPKAAVKPWLTVRNQARAEGDSVEMVISGVIGSSWYDDSGTTSREFRKAFDIVPRGTKVNIRINSEGGSVADALEIYNVCQARRDDVTCYVDGYALSSASIIALAGHKTVAPHSSILMIHEPWSMTVGDEKDHTRAAEMLSKHGDTIAQIYARRTGKTAAEMRDLMRAETWFTGAEAMDEGLSDQMSLNAACPNCQHEQDSDDETDDGDITCAGCGETHAAEEWEESQEEELVEDRFAALNLSQFKNVPRAVREVIAHAQAGGRQRMSTPAMATAPKTPTPATPAVSDSMKKKIIALLKKWDAKDLLKKHNVTNLDTATDEQLEAILNDFEMGDFPAGPKPVAGVVDASEIETLRNQLDSERRTRISAEVTRRGENRIENKNLTWWINLAMKDEAGTLAQIDALPVAKPGGEPISVSVGSPAEKRVAFDVRPKEILDLKDAGERFQAVKNNWSALRDEAATRDQRNRLPVAANTYSATLITNFLIDGAVTKLQNRWAALRVFTRDFTPDRYKPRATGQLKYVSAGGTTQKNATNFETSGDATVAPVSITVDQYTTGLHVTNDELNSGLRMENLLEVKIAEAADNILKVAFSPLALASFTTNAKITRAPAAFAFSDMATASGELKKASIKYAVLDGEYVARIENNPSFFQETGTLNGNPQAWARFGWDGVFTNTNWSGTDAGANDQYIRGLFCHPQVMGAIAGLPLTPPNVPGGILVESSFAVPGVDISVATFTWFSTATRTMWMTYDLMFGSSLLDESAGVLLVSQ